VEAQLLQGIISVQLYLPLTWRYSALQQHQLLLLALANVLAHDSNSDTTGYYKQLLVCCDF
jgi:hypothetical protein